ncbi:MAG: beta-ketoacyl synthase N-terminal-like domain-containing protein [Myxococcota bacterium]|jgi:3-oxoacyl-[acyl-carrier-protein] synthase II|nr:beta-ketoacyl synthase N-terminal-like domain-containing protein [Myxococcota bacterium]
MHVPITGVGAITPFGLGFDALWQAMVDGTCGITPLAEPLDLLRPGYGGQVSTRWPELRPLPGARGHRPLTMTRYTYLACGGIGTALASAGVDLQADAERRGLYLGSYCNMDAMPKYIRLAHIIADRKAWDGEPHRIDDERVMLGLKRFTGFEFLKLMNNMPTAHGGIQAACKGPCNTFLGFAAAGLQAVGRAGRAIEDGQADGMVTGGVGASVADQVLLTRGFRFMLSSPEAAPEQACRPFDRGATGIVPGEAGGFLILGQPGAGGIPADAEVIGELTGFATGFEPPATHPGTPAGTGAAISAARRALDEAGVEPDLVVLTGWSWAPMDSLEAAVHAEVLGDRAAEVPALVLGPTLGSVEAASGPLGAAVALRAMAEGVVPAWPNLTDPIPGWRGPTDTTARSAKMKNALILSLSPEGSHAALVVAASA